MRTRCARIEDGFRRRTIALGGVLVLVIVAAWSTPGLAARDESERYAKVSSVLVEQGTQAIGQSQFEDAVSLLEQAIVASPRNAVAFSYLGYVYQRLGKRELADKYFTTALEIDPNELRALNWGGQTDLSAADLEGAEAKLQRLSRLCGPTCAEFQMLSDAVATYKSGAPSN